MVHRMFRSKSLRVICFCGLVGILVDLDHPIQAVLQYFWFPWITNGRLWHTPLFILASLAICYMGARTTGLYSKLVLAGVAVITVATLMWGPYVHWGW